MRSHAPPAMVRTPKGRDEIHAPELARYRRRKHARQGKPGAFTDTKEAARTKSLVRPTLRSARLPIRGRKGTLRA